MSDQKYGPQTAEIESFIERLKTITPEQLGALSDVYERAVREEEVQNAWRSARAEASHANRQEIREAAWKVAWDAVWAGNQDIPRNSALYATWYPILALLVRDLITAKQFDALYGPYDTVMNIDQRSTQTVEIESFIEQVKALTPEQAEALFEIQGGDLINEIWDDVSGIVSQSGRYIGWSTAQNTVEKALVQSTAATLGEHTELTVARCGANEVARRSMTLIAARNAAWNALWALTIRDLIASEQFDALYGPWASVMETK